MARLLCVDAPCSRGGGVWAGSSPQGWVRGWVPSPSLVLSPGLGSSFTTRGRVGGSACETLGSDRVSVPRPSHVSREYSRLPQEPSFPHPPPYPRGCCVFCDGAADLQPSQRWPAQSSLPASSLSSSSSPPSPSRRHHSLGLASA